jgi:hypothetical protein
MPLVVKYAENKAVPEGPYVARLTNLEPQSHAQWGDGIRWSFEILEPAEHAGITVTAMSSTKVSPKSKIFSWVQSFGVSLQPGEEVDLESLIGKKVRVRVKNKTQTKNVEGKPVELTFSNVDALAPYTPPAAATAQTAPVPTAAAPVEQPSAEGFDGDDDFNF